MMILASSKPYIFVPLDGPKGVDLTQFSAWIAVVPDTGAEPATGDYQAATWINGEAAILVGDGQYQPGDYMIYARLSAPPEDLRLVSGRLRVGDIRT
jgi:hypothetical protein